jgi:hypothetical protein
MENATLGELADIAAEILDRYTLSAGTILLFGSGSFLFRTGAAQYAAEWIQLINRCKQKWFNCHICPLIPIIRTDTPGSMARDVGILSAWMQRVYGNSQSGLLDSWKAVLNYTESHCVATASPEVCKIPLPANTSIGSITTHCFMFHSSCPDTLIGMDHKATGELLFTLLNNINRDMNAALNPNQLVANSWVTDPGPNELPEEPPVPQKTGKKN